MREIGPGYRAASGAPVPSDGVATDLSARTRAWIFYRLLRRPVPAMLAEMMPRAFWPPEEIAAYQRARLIALVSHALKEVPYYREAIGRNLDDLESSSTDQILSAIPLLTRSMVREREDELISHRARGGRLRREASGGSTGEPVAHWIGLREHLLKGARERRSFALQGLLLGERLLRVWGARADLARRGGSLRQWADSALRSQRWFDSYRLGDARSRECVEIIRRWRPQGIFGYALGVHEVARWALDHGVEVPAPRVVITSAEHLYDDSRRDIARAFRCPVLDSYGCRETGVLAWECRENGGLHVDADQVLVEIVREGRPVPAGEDGLIVLTGLDSYAMPLLRYEMGDVGRLLTEPCSCGITLPRMAISVGRTVELLATPDGRVVHGLLLAPHNIQAPGLKQMQLEQTTVDHLIVRVVGDLAAARPSLDANLVANVRRVMGPQVRVEFQQVDSIPVAASGKRVFIFSRVPVSLRQGERIEA